MVVWTRNWPSVSMAFRASVYGLQGFIRLGYDESPVAGGTSVCVKDAGLWRSEPS